MSKKVVAAPAGEFRGEGEKEKEKEEKEKAVGVALVVDDDRGKGKGKEADGFFVNVGGEKHWVPTEKKKEKNSKSKGKKRKGAAPGSVIPKSPLDLTPIASAYLPSSDEECFAVKVLCLPLFVLDVALKRHWWLRVPLFAFWLPLLVAHVIAGAVDSAVSSVFPRHAAFYDSDDDDGGGGRPPMRVSTLLLRFVYKSASWFILASLLYACGLLVRVAASSEAAVHEAWSRSTTVTTS